MYRDRPRDINNSGNNSGGNPRNSNETSNQSPTRVLLVGTRWASLMPALRALEGQGKILVVSPANGAPDEAAPLGAASLVIMADAVSGRANTALLRSMRREQPVSPPVLLCITHEALESEDLRLDADDFLVVPCSAAELDQRLMRLARKSQPSLPSRQLRVGRVILNLDTYQVTLGSRQVDLAWMEFQLLKFLMENPGRVFTRDQLLTNVWGVDTFGGTRTVDVHIRRLRHKLSLHGDEYFRTVKNVGYGLIDSG